MINPTPPFAGQVEQSDAILSDEELGDIEFMRAYVEGCNDSFSTIMAEVVSLRAALAARPATQPKLTLALPDYETRRIVIASDEIIDDERLVCVAIKGGEAVARPDLAHHLRSLEAFYSWGSQCIMIAPPLAQLTPENQIHWRDDYAKNLREALLATLSTVPDTPTGETK